MLTFKCPYCAFERRYDPARRPKYCTRCGRALPAGVRANAARSKKSSASHQPFLDELLSHWRGTYIPDRHFRVTTAEQALDLFLDYQRALGEVGKKRFVRAYQPGRKEKLRFVQAYLLLKWGDRDLAREHLGELAREYPKFADTWIWLAATTDDPAERIDYLENAVILEAAHPLARDALSIAQGRIAPEEIDDQQDLQPRIVVVKCPHCAGTLHYEPGATEVTCQYCGHYFALQRVDLLEQETSLLGELRLRRRFQGRTWQEVQRFVHCQSCGAELVMTRHLARQCVFCGSTSVLVEDNRQALIQPDGFLPFEIDEEQAIAAIRRKRHFSKQISTMQGIYIPFWVFDGFVEARKQSAVIPGLIALGRDPEVVRELMMFDNLLFCAMGLPAARVLTAVLPYDLHTLVPYEPRLLASWPAALYRRDVEEVVEEAYDTMLEAAFRKTKPSRLDRLANLSLKHSFQVTTVTYQLVLLPVWTVVVVHEGQRLLALANGQTGDVVCGSLRPGHSSRD